MLTYFISGHLDLTIDDFNEYYVNKIQNAINTNSEFVVGDATGCDRFAQTYLSGRSTNVTIYHMFETPRNYVDKTFKTIGGFKNDNKFA
jgi:hypothetical protein